MTLSEISGRGKKGIETFAAMQTELFEGLERSNREWLACWNEEAALTTDLAKKVAESHSIPDAMSAYQEWATKQMKLLTKQSQRIMEDGRNFMNTCTRFADKNSDGGLGA